jgi:hypothetical protein
MKVLKASMDTQMPIFWLFKQVVGFLASCFFIAVGLHVLIRAYQSSDALIFLVLFFSSNFIILLSATMGFVFGYRLHKYWKETGSDAE